MFEYLFGRICFIYSDYLVLDVNGIGYKIFVSNINDININDKIKIYVHQVVKDNDILLYGFLTLKEKYLFQKLLTVSGIGPKNAISILKKNNFNKIISAIYNNDVEYLIKIPGIGKKTAQQIILDLKDKLRDFYDENIISDNLLDNKDNILFKESILALKSLGYNNYEIDSIKEKLRSLNAHDINEYLKFGLKLLNNK